MHSARISRTSSFHHQSVHACTRTLCYLSTYLIRYSVRDELSRFHHSLRHEHPLLYVTRECVRKTMQWTGCHSSSGAGLQTKPKTPVAFLQTQSTAMSQCEHNTQPAVLPTSRAAAHSNNPTCIYTAASVLIAPGSRDISCWMCMHGRSRLHPRHTSQRPRPQSPVPLGDDAAHSFMLWPTCVRSFCVHVHGNWIRDLDAILSHAYQSGSIVSGSTHVWNRLAQLRRSRHHDQQAIRNRQWRKRRQITQAANRGSIATTSPQLQATGVATGLAVNGKHRGGRRIKLHGAWRWALAPCMRRRSTSAQEVPPNTRAYATPYMTSTGSTCKLDLLPTAYGARLRLTVLQSTCFELCSTVHARAARQETHTATCTSHIQKELPITAS